MQKIEKPYPFPRQSRPVPPPPPPAKRLIHESNPLGFNARKAIDQGKQLSDALHKLAESIQAHAEATRLLASATAGELDGAEDIGEGSQFLDGPSQ